ncbi:MAG TPA: RNase adapter RapZ [Nevskiaceae bacterium]|nr:RNase adapter RapZ [Nevskiaceae bacterium]
MPMQLAIVSGLSGAGKTVALKQFEDRGWYCIDNLPLTLVQPLVAQALAHPEARYEHVAIGIDARATDAEIEGFAQTLDSVRSQRVQTRVLFLTASTDAILARYNETRRTHPRTGREVSLTDAITLERRLLAPIARCADETLDTSRLNPYELRFAVHAQRSELGAPQLALNFVSFGYKYGLPEGVDFIFDARCLPNPYWVPALRTQTGRDPAIAAYLSAQPAVDAYAVSVEAFLRRWLPAFRTQGRPYMTVAIGCTGGRHRSVYLVEHLAARLGDADLVVSTRHRELA